MPTIRPLSGAARRAALVYAATTAAERTLFRTKQRPCVVLAPRDDGMGCDSSSACRAVTQAISVAKTTRVDVMKATGIVRPTATSVHGATAGERASQKRRQPDAPCEMARQDLPGTKLLGPTKRAKMTHSAPDVKMSPATVETPVKTRQEHLKERMTAELDALRELVKKAEALSCGNQRLLAPESMLEKAPAVKRIKTSPLVEKIIDASPEEGEIVPEENEEEEFVDICGGVSPFLIREAATPLDLKASGDSDSESSSDTDSDSESGSSVSSDSDSSSSDSADSSSDSDEDTSDASVSSPAPPPVPRKKIINSSAPPAVLPEVVIDSPVQAPTPALVTTQSTKAAKKFEDNVSISILMARAEREKTRRKLREMEKAVRPDVSIHPRDLEELGIKEFDYGGLEKFGLFLLDA